MVAVALEHLLREDEVRVGVVALAHLLDGEVEDLRREPACGCAGGALTRRLPRPPRRAAPRAPARPPRARLRRARPSRARAAAPCRAPRARGRRSSPGCAHARRTARMRSRSTASDPTVRSGAAATCAGARGDAGGSDGAEQERRDEMRSAALVLLGRDRRVDIALVARDRLVLGAVVAHEVAIAQRHERRHDADRGRRELAAKPSAAAHDGGERGAHERRRGDAAVLEGEPRVGQAPADHRERDDHLRHTHHAAHERHAVGVRGRAVARRWPPDAAVGRANGRRPRGRAEERQAVAQCHTAETELLSSLTQSPIRSVRCSAGTPALASSRSRTSMRSSGA